MLVLSLVINQFDGSFISFDSGIRLSVQWVWENRVKFQQQKSGLELSVSFFVYNCSAALQRDAIDCTACTRTGPPAAIPVQSRSVGG